MATYAPIPLFAESLRVQRALVSTILTRHSISPCLTGCIKDFPRLWEMDDFELLGHFEGSPTASVVSVRHGNSFQLANKAILEACEIIGRRSSKTVRDFRGFRETLVNISFVTPTKVDSASPGQRWRTGRAVLFFVFETAITIGISVVIALRGQLLGSGLLVCVATANIILFLLRQWTDPIFGNANALHSDRYLTARGGAALDVHIIAESWNSSRLDVVSGYSSQLHALTNIPVRVNNPVFLRWSCRLLAIVLAIQAAALASLTNATGVEIWSGLIWLSIYSFMVLLKRALDFQQGPAQILESQPASVQMVESLHFSGRKAALAFISTLPVSHKVDKCAWWDVFMPKNERRDQLQAELESSDLFKTQIGQSEGETEHSEAKKRSPNVQMILEEITAALRNPSFSSCLKSYQEEVFAAVKTREV
jgi:hypothetical protein